MTSFDSVNIVKNLATTPANYKKIVTNANTPVDFIKKFVLICGYLAKNTNYKLILLYKKYLFI